MPFAEGTRCTPCPRRLKRDYREKIPARSTEMLFRAELENTDPKEIRAYGASYFPPPDEKTYGPLADVQVRATQSGEYPRWAKASALRTAANLT